MLLPEQNRSSLPYIVSVTVQCTLVLLLAIPWTVQRLINKGSIQLPTMLIFQNLKPIDPMQAAHTTTDKTSSLPTLARRVRVFAPSLSNSRASGPVSVAAPEFEFGAGAGPGIGLPIPASSDVLTHIVPAPPHPTTSEPKAETPRQLLQVGGVVQAAKLIHRVQPLYPAMARQVRVQGTVLLDAVISADGEIQQLHVLSGHPMLIASAVDAVRQWMYSPTILNGKAVEVKTTIEVRFTLSGN